MRIELWRRLDRMVAGPGEGEVFYPKEFVLTERQKRWLVGAWTDLFGFVPDAVPRYTEQRGFFYVPAIKVHWHHIVPVSLSVWYEGVDPSVPGNIVPLSERTHVGRGVEVLDEDETVIHPVAMMAYQAYSQFMASGGDGEDPFKAMRREGVQLALIGETRHDSSWDQHFLDLADMVVRKYLQRFPDRSWPIKKRK